MLKFYLQFFSFLKEVSCCKCFSYMYKFFDKLSYFKLLTRTGTIKEHLTNLCFKMQFLQWICCYNFKDQNFIYPFLNFRVNYLILYEEIYLGIYFD